MIPELEDAENKPRILIVDDERFNIDVLNGVLRDKYTIMVAMNGMQALNAVRSTHKPDLILLDIMMPDMDGYEVCRQLKADDATKDIPVIFVTAMERSDDETKGFEFGAVDYITKPINFTVTLARIKTHLELKLQRDYLSTLSLMDGITGVANRRCLNEYLDKAYQKAISDRSPLSLLMFEIDFFKLYNDYHGYLVGDDVLKLVASTVESTIQSCFNETESLVARFGGKRFACVLPETEYTKMVSTGESILDAVRSLNIPHELSSISDILTISMGGITFVPQAGTQAEEAIEGVDDMLYRAKEQGRNQFAS